MVQFDEESDIEALLRKIDEMPVGQERLLAAQKAIDIAQKADDLFWGYYAHYELCFTAVFLNKRDIVFEAFTWCLNVYDANPGVFAPESILWLFKYAIECSSEYTIMTQKKIENLLSEYKRRLEESDYSLRTYFYYKSLMNMWTGNTDSSVQEILKWKKYDIDEMSDCPACECCNAAQMLSASGFYEEATREAMPVLDDKLTCEEEPMRIMSVILKPLMRQGRYNEAAHYHEHGYNLLKQKPFLVYYMSLHIQYLVSAGRMDEALQLCLTHKKQFFSETGCWSKYHIYLFMLFLCQNLRQKGINAVTAEFPENFSLYNKRNEYGTAELERYFEKKTLDLANILDKRNAQNYFAKFAKELLGK